MATNLVKRMVERAREIIDGKAQMVPVPWKFISEYSGHGLRRGCVTVLAGPPGNGKTYLGLQFCRAAQEAGLVWRYWPMEDEAADYFERYMALCVNNWSLTGGLEENAIERIACLQDHHAEEMAAAAECFMENPYIPYLDDAGTLVIPKPNSTEILEVLLKESEKADLIFIDPLSGIRFREKGAAFWEMQEEFMSDLSNCIKGKRAHVIIVAHTAKQRRFGKEPPKLTLDSIQGSAAFQRFAQYIYLLDFHFKAIDSTVVGPGGVKRTQSHRRSLLIGKTRYAKGAGTTIAMDFDRVGPDMVEYGVIEENED
jgi:archaellum biogenesis ATPase FlaH